MSSPTIERTSTGDRGTGRHDTSPTVAIPSSSVVTTEIPALTEAFSPAGKYRSQAKPLSFNFMRSLEAVASAGAGVAPDQLESDIRGLGKQAGKIARHSFLELRMQERLEQLVDTKAFQKFTGFFTSLTHVITSDRISSLKERASRVIGLFKDPLEKEHKLGVYQKTTRELSELKEKFMAVQLKVGNAVNSILNADRDGNIIGTVYKVTKDTPRIIVQASIPASKFNAADQSTSLFSFEEFVRRMNQEREAYSPQLTMKHDNGKVITFVDARPGRVAVYINGRYQGSAWIDDALKHAKHFEATGEFKTKKAPKNSEGRDMVIAKAY